MPTLKNRRMEQPSPNIEFIGARYRLESVIGNGGMGTVYQANDRLTGQAVALKRVKTKLDDLGFNSKTADNNELALVKEFRTLSTLRHPYIIDVLDYGFDKDKNPFFTMELLEGGQPIREYAAFASTEEILARVLEMLQVLVYLHRRGILHRDIKPSNLMVVNDHIKILDFGLAKTLEARSSEYTKENIAGTMAYMAPELFKGEQVSRASDLYAVGLLAYELLAGVHPFKGNNLAHLAYEIMNTEPNWMLLSKVSDDVLDVIDRLMVKDPNARYNDATEALNDLRAALNYPPEEEALEIRESFLQAARFVGREEEYKTLRGALDDVIAGKGSAWLIGGESGVGKTRLLEELRIRIMVHGVNVLRGQANSERRETYYIWRDIARNLCIEVELSDLEAQVLKQLVPDVSRLVGREVADAVTVQPQAAIERLVQVFESALRKYKSPLVLLLEDLHWCQESLDILKHIVTLVKDIPLLLIGSFRNDARPDLPNEFPDMRLMNLGRLKLHEIRALSASMLGEVGKHSGLVEMLQRETEGNALFIIEVVRALAVEAGELEHIGRVTLPHRVFAEGIRAVIRQRLKQVPEHALVPLELAAIAGREIDVRVLRKALPDYNWRRWLVLCGDAAILAVDEYHWRFAHDKIREGIIEAIDPEKRKVYSRHIAEAIEQVYGDDPEYAVILTNHWHNAGNETAELQYAYLTAEYLHSTSNLRVMRLYLERALALAETVEIADTKRWHMEVRLAEAHAQFSDLQHARDLLENLIEKIPSDGVNEAICVKTEVYYQYVTVVVNMGDYQRGVDAAYEALRLVDWCSDAAQKAKTLYSVGMAETFNAHYRIAEEFYAECLKVAQTNHDMMFIMSAYIGLGSAAALQERFEEAIEHNQKAVELARQSGNFLYESHALHNIGAFYVMVEQYTDALPYLSEASELNRKLNVLPSLALSLINEAFCHIMLDRLGEGLEKLREGLDLAQDTLAIPFMLFGVGTYAVMLAKQEKHADAASLMAFVLKHPKGQMDDKITFNKLVKRFGYEDKMDVATKQAALLKLETIVDSIVD
jgi:eukaryotic-like serine/threonine-protein kinase